MKKNFMFAAALMLFAMAISASAQKATDFSGMWNLDLTKSKLSDREKASIESQSMTVTQTATDIKVETTTKRNAPPAGAPAGGPPPGGGGGGRMGGGMGGGGDAPTTYSLGKETKTEISGPQGAIPVTLNAKFDGAKLNLSRSSTFTTPMGEITSTTKETWELGADGKSLTINRESSSPRGTDTSTRVFTKN